MSSLIRDHRNPAVLFGLLMLFTFVMAACSLAPAAPTPDIQATVDARVAEELQVQAQINAAVAKALQDGPTPPPTQTPVSSMLTPSQVFAQFSPAVGFVETEYSTGSTILLAGGYLLTNAHVVGSSTEAERVLFPDGEEFLHVPIAASDRLLDVAILGPVKRSGGLVVAAEEAPVAIGADVFLIGYPGEVDSSPQPTITGGILSRIRESQLGDVSYFQTDATIAGGQSGGLLVSASGVVLGMSGFTWEGFGLALAADDLRLRIETMLGPSNESYRPAPHLAASNEFDMTLDGEFDQKGFFVPVPKGQITFRASVSGQADLFLALIDDYDLYEPVDEYEAGGTETIEFDLVGPAYYALVVSHLDVSSVPFYLETSVPVHPVVDPEPHILSNVIPPSGTLVRGAFDYSGDTDAYKIDLVKGQILKVIARSILGDPMLTLWDETGADPIAEDDDSGGGLWGTDAELVVVAPATGTYTILVSDAFFMGGAEYELALTLK